MSKEIIHLDLFSGIGGFAKGFQNAGYTIKEHYFSEIDKHAIACYQYNFKNAKPLGSVVNISGGDLPNRPNLITFGSHCQDFSLAGKRTGMGGQRSSLISEAIRLIRECRPDVFVWENVKGAFSSNNGRDFWAIIAAFADIGGYRLEWQLLNTSWFLPQNRERIYLVGHLADRSKPGIFPFREADFMDIKSRKAEKEIRSDNRIALTQQARQYSSWNGDFIKHNSIVQLNQLNNFGESSTKQQDRIYSPDGIMATLSSSRTETKVNIVTRPHGFNKGNETEHCPTLKANGFEHNNFVSVKPVITPNREQKRQNGRRVKEDGEPSFTISCQDHHGVMINDSHIRRLTEIECERLQGYEDDWTRYGVYDKQVWTNKKEKTFKIVKGVKEIPKTARYKMCGNTVTVDVVEAIAKRIEFIQDSFNK